jgi:hypothetical protein
MRGPAPAREPPKGALRDKAPDMSMEALVKFVTAMLQGPQKLTTISVTRG